MYPRFRTRSEMTGARFHNPGERVYHGCMYDNRTQRWCMTALARACHSPQLWMFRPRLAFHLPAAFDVAGFHVDPRKGAAWHQWMAVPPSLAPVFLDELIARFSQDDSLDPVLGRAMRALTQYILKPPGTSSAAASTSARSPQASSSSPLTGTASAASAATSTSTQNADLNDVQSVLAQMLGLPDPCLLYTSPSPRDRG